MKLDMPEGADCPNSCSLNDDSGLCECSNVADFFDPGS